MNNQTESTASLRGSPICTGEKKRDLRRRLSRGSQASAARLYVLYNETDGNQVTTDLDMALRWAGKYLSAGCNVTITPCRPPKSANEKLSDRS